MWCWPPWLIYICIAGIDGLYIAQTADGGRVNSEMYVDLVVAVTMAFAVANQVTSPARCSINAFLENWVNFPCTFSLFTSTVLILSVAW